MFLTPTKNVGIGKPYLESSLCKGWGRIKFSEFSKTWSWGGGVQIFPIKKGGVGKIGWLF